MQRQAMYQVMQHNLGNPTTLDALSLAALIKDWGAFGNVLESI
jgi:hypothetical protein